MSRDVNEPILDVSRDVIEPILDERVTYIPGVHERTQSIKCYSRSKALRSFVDTRYIHIAVE